MKTHEFAIIGAGFGGLGMAAMMQQEGRQDFIILERAARVGGTWRDNEYPGCGCDVPSHLYWYSFDRQRPNWSRHFALQPEIQRNIEDFALRSGLLPHIRFGSTVQEARWDDAASEWMLQLQDGAQVRAKHLIAATGQLANPSYRGIRGREAFQGIAFHSAQWRHDVALEGKRVAVIGNGASAIQLIPQVAEVAGKLQVFQRSPAYVVPRNDRVYSQDERQTFLTDDTAYRASRKAIFDDYEGRYASLIVGSDMANAVKEMARQHLEAQVQDPMLREKLWPDYEIGCKRILISDNLYPAFCRPNVELVTEGIVQIEAEGIRTQDGVLHPADVIVFATGFESTQFLGELQVYGRQGKSLKAEAWREVPRAYYGMVEAGFPNFYMLYGPNTNLNHNSIIAMMEVQSRYILQLVKEAEKCQACAIDVKSEAVDQYNVQLQDELRRMAFGTGCNSWYLTDNGHVSNVWSGSVDDYERRAAKPDFDAFAMTA